MGFIVLLKKMVIVLPFPKGQDQIRNLVLSGHVGFDSLPDQLVSKSVQNGFVFNIMCIGEFN